MTASPPSRAFDRPEGDADVLAGSAARLSGIAGGLAVVHDAVEVPVTDAVSSWTGPRAEDFRTLETGVRVAMVAGARAARDLAQGLSELRLALQRAVDDVEDHRRTAERATSVALQETAHLPPGDLYRTGVLQAAERTREHYETLARQTKRDVIRQALGVATRVDAITARAVPGGQALTPDELRARVSGATGVQALAGVTSLGPDQAWALAGPLLHPDPTDLDLDETSVADRFVTWLTRRMTPAAVASWWNGLSGRQQLALVVDRPGAIGNLDGVPGWARDLANRRRIDALRDELERQRDEAEAAARRPYTGPGTAFGLPSSEAARLDAKLTALDVVERRIRLDGRQLLLLDADDGWQLHAAIAIGDVDTADNVAVFVPGLTSTVQGSLDAYDGAVARLLLRAQRTVRLAGGTDTVAVITWLGYDAPQLGEIALGARSVALPHLAEEGGDRLADFLAGIDASRLDDPHLVVLGHSYGSTTTGYALRHAGTGVDDAILFGSPGAGTSDVGDLHVPPGHVYALAADLDPVADLGSFGRPPDTMPGVTVLSTEADPPLHLVGSTGHTHYLDEGSTSQFNLAAVTVGTPTLADAG
jgi:hypothetical protein